MDGRTWTMLGIFLASGAAWAAPDMAEGVDAALVGDEPAAMEAADEGGEGSDGDELTLDDLPVDDPAALRAALAERLQLGEVDAEVRDQIIEGIASRLEFSRSLTYQHGDVTVGDGLANLSLGDAFAYLGPDDAEKVLVAWGNPPSDEPTLGMIVPAGMDVMDDDSWVAVLQYEDDGHIDDADAASTDFNQILKDMQASTRDANSEREAAGYEAVTLRGWAEPPHYDSVGKKLYWAKDLQFGDGDGTLNYDIRVLGREGVLAVSAVAALAQLDDVREGMKGVLPRVTFNDGHRYEDFDPSVDRMAAYGIGALIAGGVAAKAGLFKGLIAVLLAAKKLVVLAVVGIAAAIKSLFSGKGDKKA